MKCQAFVLCSPVFCSLLVPLLQLIVPNTCYKLSPCSRKNYRELDGKTNICRNRSFIEPTLVPNVWTLRLNKEIAGRCSSWQMVKKLPTETGLWRQRRSGKYYCLPFDSCFRWLHRHKTDPVSWLTFHHEARENDSPPRTRGKIFHCPCVIPEISRFEGISPFIIWMKALSQPWVYIKCLLGRPECH